MQQAHQSNIPLPARQERLLLLIIIFIGVLLRFYKLEGTSLYNDELSALNRLRFNNFHDLIQFGVQVDGHPAGVQVFLYYWTRIFGDSVTALRIPFAIAGIIAIPYAYAWSKIWFGSWPALFTALAVSMLEFPIYYSQLARPYAPGLLFSMMLLYYWTRLLFKQGPKNRSAYVPVIITATLCAYMHHFSMLFAVIVCLSGVFFVRGKALLNYFIACVVIAILYLPELPVTIAQLKLGGLPWMGRPGNDYLWFYTRHIFNYSYILLGLTACILLLSLILGRKKLTFTHFHVLAILFCLLPLLIGFIKSRMGLPVLQPYVLLFSFPLLPAFLFSWTGLLPSTRLKFICLSLLSATCLISIFFERHYYTTEHYGQFKVLADKTIAWDQKYGEANIDRYISINNKYYIQYYYRSKANIPEYKMYRYDAMPQIDTFFSLVKTSPKPYLCEAWSNIGHPGDIIDKMIRLKYPKLVEQDDHFISGIRLYTKNENVSTKITPIFEEQIKSDTGIGAYSKLIPLAWNSHLLRCSITITADTLPDDVELVASSEIKGNVKFWKTMTLRDMANDDIKARSLVWYVILPEKTEPDELLKLYVWNHTKTMLKCINMKIEVY